MAEDYVNQLLQSIDIVVNKRLEKLPYDRTILATITNTTYAYNGRYRVTTDDCVQFDAYSTNSTYEVGDRVYIRIPANNYSEQKVITDKYVPEQKISVTAAKTGFYYMDQKYSTLSSTDISFIVNDNNNFTASGDMPLPIWAAENNTTLKGYTGLGLQFNIIPSVPANNTINTLTLNICINGYNLTTGIEDSIIQTVTGADLITNYSNIGDGITEYNANINLSLTNLNPSSITIQAITGTGNPPVKFICQPSLGYIFLNTINNNDYILSLYKYDDLSMYYTYTTNSNELVRTLGLRLLQAKLINNTLLMCQQPLYNDDNNDNPLKYSLILGVANDITIPTASVELDGAYTILDVKTLIQRIDDQNYGIPIQLNATAKLTDYRAYLKGSFDGQEYLSNILSFYGRSDAIELYTKFNLTPERDTFYLYGLDNALSTISLAMYKYSLQLDYINELNANDTLAGATFTITKPQNNTMITEVGLLDQVGEDQDIQFYNDEYQIKENSNINTIKFYFKINNYYSQQYNKNTITITITKSNRLYNITQTLLFGSSGSQGNDYILNMWLSSDANGQNIIQGYDKHNADNIYVNYNLYNYQNECIKTFSKQLSFTPNEKPYIYEFYEGDNDLQNIYKIKGFLPIAVIDKSKISRVDAPTTIIYNVNGCAPMYYKDEMKLYAIDSQEPIDSNQVVWSIENDAEQASDKFINLDNNRIRPRAGYSRLSQALELVAKLKESNSNDFIEVYRCPLYIGINKFYTPMINIDSNQIQLEQNAGQDVVAEGSASEKAILNDMSFGSFETDNSQLFLGHINNNPYLTLYAQDKTSKETFYLTGNKLRLGGLPIDNNTGIWDGTSQAAIYIMSRISNDDQVSYSLEDIGSNTQPIYVNSGVPTPVDTVIINGETYTVVDAINKIVNALTSNFIESKPNFWTITPPVSPPNPDTPTNPDEPETPTDPDEPETLDSSESPDESDSPDESNDSSDLVTLVEQEDSETSDESDPGDLNTSAPAEIENNNIGGGEYNDIN